MIRSHSSGVISVNGVNESRPALVTMISTGPRSVPYAGERRVDGGAVRDVDERSQRLCAGAPEVVRRALGGVTVEVEHGDAVTVPRQALTDREPHAGRAAGDHCDPAHGAGALMMQKYGRTRSTCARLLSEFENVIAAPRLGARAGGDGMRIGMMVGPERGRYREKVARLVEDAEAAEQAGFASIWVPQIPDDFDGLTAAALMGRATSRIELGTAVMVIQTRHPVAMAQQVLSTQAVCEGRFTLGLGPSHHWIVEDMLGLRYERPARLVRDYLEVLNTAFAGPGQVDVENDSYRVHNPIDITDLPPTHVLLAALAPVMLRIAGEHASGTILWMADERAIGDHIVPRITKAAEEAGRPRPRVVAGVPVVLCSNDEVDEARARANRRARTRGVLAQLRAPARAR